MRNERPRQAFASATPLQDENSERAIVGICLADQSAFWDCHGKLMPHHFTVPRLARIWAAMCRLAEMGKPVVREMLSQAIAGEEKGDLPLPAYVAALLADAPQASFAGEFRDTLLHFAGRRAIIERIDISRAQVLSCDISTPISEVAGAIVNSVSEAAAEMSGGEVESFASIVSNVRKEQRAEFGAARQSGVITGIKALDDMFGPSQRGKLTVIGGSPGAGKSVLGEMIAELAAKTVGGVIVFQRDMNQADVVSRAISRATSLSVGQIEGGQYGASEYEIIEAAAEAIARMDIELDTRSTTIEQIAARAAAKKRAGNLNLIVVDHLRKFGTQKRSKDKWETYERVSGGLKEMAFALGVPVVCISQLTRFSQRKDIPAPEMGDLDGGGALEQDCDKALILFSRAKWILREKLSGIRPSRDVFSGTGSESRGDWIEKYFECEGKVEAHIVKNRLGGLGVCPLRFNGGASRFEEVSR